MSRKHSSVGSPPSASLTTHQSLAARRLSRTIHIPVRPPHSGRSSRSTSRSRSPLPPSAHPPTGYSDAAPSERSYSEQRGGGGQSPSANRRSSRILVDDPVDPIMSALYELIALATDVLELSLAQLTAKPKTCEALVQRVQAIGKAWDDHPDWNGRNWYVQVLLAVASLSRVVEWWEAEKQFWNFDDNKEGGEQDEPLQFVTKFAEDEDKGAVSPPPAMMLDGEQSQPLLQHHHQAAEQDVTNATVGGALRLVPQDEDRLKLSRPPSGGRRSRDEKDVEASMTEKEEEIARSSKLMDTAESARVLATERLRLQAETAQNRNIVMELSLDGDHFIWINYAWRFVVGCVWLDILLRLTC
jgi:serine/threonine-protein kinase RIM15